MQSLKGSVEQSVRIELRNKFKILSSVYNVGEVCELGKWSK